METLWSSLPWLVRVGIEAWAIIAILGMAITILYLLVVTILVLLK